MVAGYQGGVHTNRHGTVNKARNTQQLGDEAQLVGDVNVLALQLVNAGVRHVVDEHAGVEGDGRQDCHLGRRVATAHVLGGVGLGVAQILRLLQGIGVGHTALPHLREDVIGGAVDDAHDRLHLGGKQRLAQHLDHRDGGAHGRLEAQLAAALLGGGQQLGCMTGEQLLVGGHH